MDREDTAPGRGIEGVAAQLRPAWPLLAAWERTVEAELGDELCAVLPFLWAQWHVGHIGPDGPLMVAEPAADSSPCSDPEPDLGPFEAILRRILADDLIMVTFACGAAWGEARSQSFRGADAA